MDFLCIVITNFLPAQVPGRLSSWSFWSYIRLGQPAINNKIRRVHETALVARQEYHSMGLFDSLSKPPGREVNLAPESFLLIATQEVLEHGGAST